MSASLRLETLAPACRMQAWKDAVCDTFVKLECEHLSNTPVHGRLNSTVIGDLHVARVIGSPQRVSRTRQLALQSNEAFVLVSVQLKGVTILEQGGSVATLTPGSIGFYDTARPYQLTLPKDFDQIVLHLPRDLFERECPGGLNFMALKLAASNPFVNALSAMSPKLTSLHPGSDSQLANKTALTAINLLALSLDSLQANQSGSLTAQASKSVHQSEIVFLRCLDAIRKRLTEPELTPNDIARDLRISLRRLQEIFQENQTTVSDCIWDLRLEFARTLLCESQYQDISITSLAFRAGFNDPAHFSRRFKQKFKMTPRDYRLQNL